MIKTKTQKLVTAGLMLALGILLPFVTSHGIGFLPGKVFLPMHIPVLLCSFFCGSGYGAILGLILPFLNSFLTSMPVLFPNAVIMSGELFTYGLTASLLHKLFNYNTHPKCIYPSLLVSMIAGRVVYGIIAAILLFVNPGMKSLSVITAVTDGIPGIIIQLILIPSIISGVSKNTTAKYNAEAQAIKLIKSSEKSCVVVKNNKIISAESPRGIAHILNLHDEGILKGTFVADEVIGKAAAMIFSESGVVGCYGYLMSKSALRWLEEHKIDAQYNTLTDNIINRRGDDICPMEKTVLDVCDSKEAVKLLKEKVAELSGRTDKKTSV